MQSNADIVATLLQIMQCQWHSELKYSLILHYDIVDISTILFQIPALILLFVCKYLI